MPADPHEIQSGENDPPISPDEPPDPELQATPVPETPDGKNEPRGEAEPSRGAREIGRDGDGKTEIEVKVELNKAEAYKIEVNGYKAVYGDGESSALEVFGRGHCSRFDEKILSEWVRHLVFDEREVQAMAESLRLSRLLFLTGEPNLGKGAAALKLAHCLWQMRPDLVQEVLMVRTLNREVRVSLERICSHTSDFGRRILIFEDAFDLENQELLRVVEGLDSGRLGALRKVLEDSGVFMVFTSDRNQLPSFASFLKNVDLLCELPQPTESLLRQGLERHLHLLCRSWSEGDRDVALQFLKEHSTEILLNLKTLPRVSTLLDGYLADLSAGNIALDQALARVDDLSGWLLDDLVKTPETLSFVLSLILAHAAPQLRPVPWFQFYSLWSATAAYIRRSLQKEDCELEPRDLCADEFLLCKSRAEVQHLPFPSPDSVHFVDSSYPSRLWQVLLGPARGLVSLVVPLLRELMESGDFYLREAAARALGRIGQIDPLYLVRPIIASHSRSQKPMHHVALGELFQGTLGARDMDRKDEHYVGGCLSWLRQETAGRAPKAAWVRVICIREIGAFDLTLAARELRHLIVEKLDDKASELSFFQSLLRKLEASDRPDAAAFGASGTMDRWHKIALDQIASATFDSTQQEIIVAVRYCVVGLCLVEDPTSVFQELYGWLVGTDRGLAAMLSWLFLDQNGIADTLDRTRISLPVQGVREGEPLPLYSRILAAVTLGNETVGPFGKFLERIYGATREFPGLFRRRLRSNFRRAIKGWAQEAVRFEETACTMEALLSHLLATKNPELRDEIFSLLQHDRDFLDTESELHRLSVRVIAG